MIAALWLACTAFVAGFLYRRLPEVFQDAVIAWSIVALLLLWGHA
jgi:hypothetical protein